MQDNNIIFVLKPGDPTFASYSTDNDHGNLGLALMRSAVNRKILSSAIFAQPIKRRLKPMETLLSTCAKSSRGFIKGCVGDFVLVV